MHRRGHPLCWSGVTILSVDLFLFASRCRRIGLFCAIRRLCLCDRMCGVLLAIIPSFLVSVCLLPWLFWCRLLFHPGDCSSWLGHRPARYPESRHEPVPKKWLYLDCCHFWGWSGSWWYFRWLILAAALTCRHRLITVAIAAWLSDRRRTVLSSWMSIDRSWALVQSMRNWFYSKYSHRYRPGRAGATHAVGTYACTS